MAFSLSCSEHLASVRKQCAWICKLAVYQEEANPNTAIFKDKRSLVELRTFVSRSKKATGCDSLQIQEITEEEFSHRAGAATADRSRSPRRTITRHTPFESIRELAPKLT